MGSYLSVNRLQSRRRSDARSEQRQVRLGPNPSERQQDQLKPQSLRPVHEFGKGVNAEHFIFDPVFRNLNHGSLGAVPRAVRDRQRYYQDQFEARPDCFYRFEYIKRLDESREALAELLKVPTETIVLVPNATTAVNTVLRNLEWAEDGLDEIVYFDTTYTACANTISYVVDSSKGLVKGRCISLHYPCSDMDVLDAFHDAIRTARDVDGRRPRICVFDVISSLPGVRFPFATLTQACRDAGILSLIDGAHGIGMVPDLDLPTIDTDFFVSNCHKWLYVPRACAVFYVPVRNQALLRSTLPTSHGYLSTTDGKQANTQPSTGKSAFVTMFEFVGTADITSYLCVKDAIGWRQDVLGGETRIVEYMCKLAREGGNEIARILGTEVMDNSAKTLTDCAMVNVALPLATGTTKNSTENLPVDNQRHEREEQKTLPMAVPAADTSLVTQWMIRILQQDHKTFVPLYVYHGRWWARISAQVYLDMDDFVWAGKILADVCDRVRRKEYQTAQA